MTINRTFITLFAAALLSAASALAASPATLTVHADRPGARINSDMWGVFFEDINFGADGGIYAELVKNRAFEFPDPMMGWTPLLRGEGGNVSVQSGSPFHPANPHYVRLRTQAAASAGVVNEGFRGMGFRAGEVYELSLQARTGQGTPTLGAELLDADGSVIASVRVGSPGVRWRQLTATLTPSVTTAKGRLHIFARGAGTVEVDMISLFPRDTWQNRANGMRADMAQLLADMKPGFLRFPGGCIVEGNVLTNRYQWKTTIGPVEERKLIVNRWNFEFRHRPTPDYYQSFGLGFFEYFQLAADLDAEAMPILNCGMACQFNSGELCPMDQLDEYIQDALDLIEFANGPATSEWGGKRAAMGRVEPFNFKYLGIGNEQWGPQFVERYARFHEALKAKHPEILLIGTSGPAPEDERFDYLWPKMRELQTDIVDEHCYANPHWFFTRANRYDSYPCTGPKVFFGEYAAQSDRIVSVENQNNWLCALSEAAFMTGMERNSDVVTLASYAPLFAHIDAWQWRPNLIWADNLRAYGTPNYHVQALFSRHRGDVVLPVKLEADDGLPKAAAGGLGLGTYRTAAEFKDVKVTRGGQTLYTADFTKGTSGWRLPREGRWQARDGALQQTDAGATATAFTVDANWTDYTVTLKARKTGGAEGFLINVRNGLPNTRVQWNLGGWGNTRHGLQSWLGVQDQLVGQVPGSIEEGRWYDIKIELQGPRVNCYLDGQLVQTAEIPVPKTGGLFASAVKDEAAREVVLKLVNATAAARDFAIQLDGVKAVKPGAKGILLTSEKLTDVNDFDTPNRVAPREVPVKITSPQFTQSVPANAFMVLRVPVGEAP